MKIEHIRNFSIIAHIDHGKSTLADRLLEITNTIDKRQMQAQMLDSMDLERERGITIKAAAATLKYKHKGKDYILNLIDTPGHVDFTYEVTRALAACEGALLVVDAAQGIEAQTVANMHLAMGQHLTVIPILNKIDLQAARPEEVIEEIETVFALPAEDVIGVSAKTGLNCEAVLQAIIEKMPPPEGDPDKPLRALIFDARYDDYRGVILYVRVVDGSLRRGDKIRLVQTQVNHEALEVGVLIPGLSPRDDITAGEVGYIVAGIKSVQDVNIGDTVTLLSKMDEIEVLPGYREPRPMVYCGIYPTVSAEYDNLRKGLDRLRLSDSALTFVPENSEALGQGFRCGFLGLLHMEIVQERLERESNLHVVQTAPNVNYEIVLNDGTVKLIEAAADMPDPNYFTEVREPFVMVKTIVPSEFVGSIMSICTEKRGEFSNQEYLGHDRVILSYSMPLAEVIFDYHDRMKSATRGYGTMDYEFEGYKAGPLVKMRIMIGGGDVDALSCICHRDVAEARGRALLKRLKEEIPRHLFQVALQAAVGGKVVARENIGAMAKNVTAKCYGGDVSRKRKLLEKQKKGKKRMKMVGNVEVPQEAFLSILTMETGASKGSGKRKD
jgi:GTP-binding protein LepA